MGLKQTAIQMARFLKSSGIGCVLLALLVVLAIILLWSPPG